MPVQYSNHSPCVALTWHVVSPTELDCAGSRIYTPDCENNVNNRNVNGHMIN